MALIAEKLSISFWLLLAIYGAIPLLFGVAIIDVLFFSSRLQALLPSTPDTFILYGILFNVPHIVASYFSLADREYLAFYKRKLLFVLPLVLGLFVLLGIFYPPLAYVLFIAYTLYHVVFQQAGLTLLFGARFSKWFDVWRWLPVVFVTLGHLSIYHPALIPRFTSLPLSTLPLVLLALVGGFALLSGYLFLQIKQLRGRLYFGATALSFAGSYVLYAWGYPLLSIFLIRFVHDITAFIIYAVHDHNRAVTAGTNALYNLFSPTRIPVVMLTPLLALVIGYFITASPWHQTNLIFIMLFGATHYYIESFIWKRDTIHRTQLAFT